MSGSSSKTRKQDELRQIEDALVQSILDASPDDLRAELAEAGEDPDAYVALADAMLAKAEEQCGRARLERAKAEVAARRSPQRSGATSLDLSKAKAKLDAIRASGSSSEMMLAARKGEGLTDRDEQALLEALAELDRLESEDGHE